MTDIAKIAEGLSDNEKFILHEWRFKSWVNSHNAPHSLVALGLFDQHRFPAQHRGKTKRRLNETGLAVRAYLENLK